uniref:Cytochrome P450 n=1 Tax=Oryza barthii TaxID=65489 RepID=A0A0D3F4F1_9ORYZ
MDHIFSTNAWLTIALVFIITLAAKVVRSSVTLPAEKTSKPRPPPEAKGAPLVGIIPAVLRRGLQAVIREQHRALGSVFTLRSLGLAVTFLVGPECSDHFFHAPEWEIAIDGLYEVTVPIFGKEVGYDIDLDTRNEQHRFFAKMLRPAKLRGHVLPMEYFGKWGECGVVDLMQEVDHVLMLIASRCLLGKEVRENMFDEVASLFHELMGGMHVISMFFPYLPTPGHRRRDKARAKLGEIFSQIVKTRKMSGRVEDDMLQDLIDSTYGDGRATTRAPRSPSGRHCACSPTPSTCAPSGRSRSGSWLRRARRGFTVRDKEGGEYSVPAGRLLASPLVVNTLLPNIYKDPHVFDPDRFAAGRAEDKAVAGARDLAYLSFGAGKHACMGEGYAYQQIKVILSHLVSNFELKLESPFPETEDMLSMRPKGKVIVSYKRRTLS